MGELDGAGETHNRPASATWEMQQIFAAFQDLYRSRTGPVGEGGEGLAKGSEIVH
jgi:hypothetical protein